MQKETQSPTDVLENLATKYHVDVYSERFPQILDELDPLRDFKKRFDIPKKGTIPTSKVNSSEAEEDCLYIGGFSLGLKPKDVEVHIAEYLDQWRKKGSTTFLGKPYYNHGEVDETRVIMGQLVGADPRSVIFMNGLSINLHLLLISFYQPTDTRYKILITADAFSSDRYIVQSQAELRGFNHKEAILEIGPRPGEHTIRTEDILKVIEEEGDSICVVCFSAINFYTGQKFDMEVITKSAQAKGAYVGWDLAHAAGNVVIRLDDWGVDFAFWCSNKYLLGGPGGIGGAYLNKKHNGRQAVHLKGWRGGKEATRYDMTQECDMAEGIDAFEVTTPATLLISCMKAGLNILKEAGMEEIQKKNFLLTSYFQMLMEKEFAPNDEGRTPTATMITPQDPNQRGAQLTFVFSVPVKDVHVFLQSRGVVCGIRPPCSLRVSAIPLYNSFSDVFTFVAALKEAFQRCC